MKGMHSPSVLPHTLRPRFCAVLLLCWAGFAEASVGDCVKQAGLGASSALQGTRAVPETDKISTDKTKKHASGSSGVLRMLIPSALRQNTSS